METQYIKVKNKNGSPVTWYNVLKKLQQIGFDPGCDHRILECIQCMSCDKCSG